jgi:hypothetical protein
LSSSSSSASSSSSSSCATGTAIARQSRHVLVVVVTTAITAAQGRHPPGVASSLLGIRAMSTCATAVVSRTNHCSRRAKTAVRWALSFAVGRREECGVEHADMGATTTRQFGSRRLDDLHCCCRHCWPLLLVDKMMPMRAFGQRMCWKAKNNEMMLNGTRRTIVRPTVACACAWHAAHQHM